MHARPPFLLGEGEVSAYFARLPKSLAGETGPLLSDPKIPAGKIRLSRIKPMTKRKQPNTHTHDGTIFSAISDVVSFDLSLTQR